ncbi:PAS/PAC sensor hybrid histidine kinase [Crinalium epipsammum PCC 9333]|uniref:histidine kinase n=1 Tax=Crinalium epipsammum PCC 9333 TaxID=1173022 RepID=K9VXR5_9CYAN|nr:response regulator [Crinalium epipsammum]AFZ11945.1 PAS/PAC sensor hybrid histidine kinase [Crinalium epipsammum PCC 9333]
MVINKDRARVLLVDDDEDDYILTAEWLSEIQRAKFTLEWVATYDAALEIIAKKEHDVYLLDYRLGEYNGLELLQEAIALGCQAPIILLTGQGDHEIDLIAMKAGAADYLDKSKLGAQLLERSIRYAIERKQSEHKIREQAALLDIATDAIFVQDLENRILFWNKGAEHLYGFSVTEALNQNVNQLLYKQAEEALLEIEQQLTANGEWQGELNQFTKDGKKIIVQSRWTLVEDQQQKPKSILVVNTDITEKKQLELQFLRTQRMESLGTLAGGIAHDLNNVLAPILMAVQLLQLKLLDHQSQEWLEILENNVKRGANLVKQVLSFARGYEGDRATLQIRHIIAEIKQIAKETFPKSIEIYTDISSELWTVSGDATQLHQILLNLCVNARDAMPDGGKLSITAENIYIDESYARINIDAKVGYYVVITVSDVGTGINSEIIDKIFDPFFTTKELGKGTGLGLSTAIGIIKSHGGFIKVYSEIGKGTQFKVFLPAVEVSETQVEQHQQNDLRSGQGELILVVDDEEAICQVTKLSLEVGGYQVITAKDGVEAITLYAQHKEEIRLVLADMMMPSMDGSLTIRTLQKINPHVRIIAVSGLESNAKIAEMAGSSVKSFLLKPYSGQELLKTVHDVMAIAQ